MKFDRTNISFFGRWWWTLDRLTLVALLVLIAFGAIMVTAASPSVAERIGLDSFYFIRRQHFFLALSLLVIVGISLLSPVQVRRLGILGLLTCLVLMILVLFIGEEVKGAHRWITIGGMSLQPSEFMKPCFAVVTAWLFAEKFANPRFPAYRVSMILYGIFLILLVLQPDIGMVVTYTLVWMIQLFLAGLPLLVVALLGLLGAGGLYAAYQFLPHVTQRINNFLDPAAGDNYQVSKALEAFRSGGFFGKGPGEGAVKKFIPDSHTDFIFAVAGEEFGAIACILILSVFAFVVVRGVSRVWRESDIFIILATSGLLAQFGIQALINMGVAVHLLPAKGMTLPFLSYGGSSLLAFAFSMGMVLALTRRRYGYSFADDEA